MLDFPATHSMDTYWFAIDADENVAVFDTGEMGALPHSTRKLMEGKQIADIETFIQYLPRDDRGIIRVKTSGEMAARGATLKTLRNEIRSMVGSSLETLGWMVLVLSSDEVIPKLEIQSQLAFRFSGEPVVIYLDYCDIPTIERLIKSREILGGKRAYLSSNSALAGLFSYRHENEWENWISGPYQRHQKPEQPLKLAELPEEIQDLISWTWLEQLRFQETERIQPIEYTECYRWSGMGNTKSWVDTKGQRHD